MNDFRNSGEGLRGGFFSHQSNKQPKPPLIKKKNTTGSMFEALRKYGSVFMLVLMGMVMVCLIADDYGDSQQLLTQTASSTCTAVVADDFDLDDDDDEAVNISFVENKAWTSIPTLETIGPITTMTAMLWSELT